MPPANSPQETPPAPTAAASPYLQQLEAISSPVPNFAATLTTQSEDDANHENVSFLRTRLRSSPDNSLRPSGRRRQPYLTEEEFERFETENRDRMRRAVESGRRTHTASAAYTRYTDLHNYPSQAPRQESAYDWSAASEEEEDEDGEDGEDPPRYPYHLDHQNRAPQGNEEEYPQIDWAYYGAQQPPPPEAYPSRRAAQTSGAFANQYNESSLATAALLQSVRRYPRFSQRSRSTLSNYIQDPTEREQHPRRESEAERQRARFPRPIYPNREIERTSGYPGPYTAASIPQDPPESNPREEGSKPPENHVKNAMRYLERVRFCTAYEERLSTAAAAGFVRSDFFCKDHDDFILDTTTLDPPRQTSWLKNGCVFTGSQHAAHGSSSVVYHQEWTHGRRALRLNQNWTRVSTPPAQRSGGNNTTVQTTSGRRYVPGTPSGLSPSSSSPSTMESSASEHWPVTVTLHSIDYDTMTVSGTMEARSIPDKSSPTHESSITTFLEGEIIDFNTHTLETKSFRSEIETDATYWSRLPPFREMTLEDITKCLLSREWVSEKLQGKWVLMRWKERCMLQPTQPRTGLTISGFYYISLNRENGVIEGLYYDPGSSPYQYLTLRPEGMTRTFPAYEFR